MVKTTNTHVGSTVENRYVYDFGLCSKTGDWSQMDTARDASYFGYWANPFKRTILGYAEGDLTTIECDTDEEFVAELSRIAAFQEENNAWKGIDTWSVRIRDRFVAAGAGDLIHAACFRMAPDKRTDQVDETVTAPPMPDAGGGNEPAARGDERVGGLSRRRATRTRRAEDEPARTRGAEPAPRARTLTPCPMTANFPPESTTSRISCETCGATPAASPARARGTGTT